MKRKAQTLAASAAVACAAFTATPDSRAQPRDVGTAATAATANAASDPKSAQQILHDIFTLQNPRRISTTIDIPNVRGRALPIRLQGFSIAEKPAAAGTIVRTFDPWRRPMTVKLDLSSDRIVTTPMTVHVIDSLHFPTGTKFEGTAFPISNQNATGILWNVIQLPNGRLLSLPARREPTLNRAVPNR